MSIQNRIEIYRAPQKWNGLFRISERIHLYRKNIEQKGIRIRIAEFKISESFSLIPELEERKDKENSRQRIACIKL
jgi:hypothetical protein